MSRAAEHISFHTNDPDEGHDFIVRTYSDNRMKVLGARDDFRFTYDYRSDGPLNRAECSYALTIEHAMEPLGMLLLGRVLRGRVERTAAGRTARLGTGEVFLVSAPDAPHRISWDDMDLELVAVDLATLRDLTGCADDQLPRFELLEPASPQSALQCGTALDLGRQVLASPDAAPLLVDNVARTVAATVLAAFPHRRLENAPPEATPRAQAVRRAVDHMEAHAARPLGLQEIAMAAHVAPRTLQLAFRSELDVTPMQHLRGIRLARAHHDLVRADPSSGATVTDIAMRWGFTHPSRFAAAYRRRYGRSPRETLQA